jgi:hypothetical protein
MGSRVPIQRIATLKTKPALLLLSLGFLSLPLFSGTVRADGDRGGDRGWWGTDRGHYHHHHRHQAGHRHSLELVRRWDRWDRWDRRERGPILVYRDGPRYERPWVEDRTIIYVDPRR